MPEIEQHDYTVISNYFSEEFEKERSKGCHMMQIVEDLEERLGMSRKNARFGDTLSIFATLGFVWERVIGRALSGVEIERGGGKVIRPGEQFRDGIYATPDAFNVRQYRLEEWKCTWRKAPENESEFETGNWKWLVQSMGYMHLLGCNVAVIRVFYVMGNWNLKDWSGPSVKMWEVRATDEELEENWRMIVNHKKTMEKGGKAPWVGK